MLIPLIGAAIAGYLLGASPFAYLLLRSTQGRDIRREGTGNVGAMNAYEVTGRKYIGILVGVLDILKGAAAVGVGVLIGQGNFIAAGVAALFAVVGHNYNIFLAMRGGRGLAVAAGAMGVISPLPVLLFGLMWITGYVVIRRNVHVANVAGVLGATMLMFSAPELLLAKLTFIPYEDPMQLRFLVLMICLQILVRHIEPMRALLMQGGGNDNP